jgi:hypothetical protein
MSLPNTIEVSGFTFELKAGDDRKSYSVEGFVDNHIVLKASNSTPASSSSVIESSSDLTPPQAPKTFENLKQEIIDSLTTLANGKLGATEELPDDDETDSEKPKLQEEKTKLQEEKPKLSNQDVVDITTTIIDKLDYNTIVDKSPLTDVINTFKDGNTTIEDAIKTIREIKTPSGGKRSNTNKVTRRRKSQPKKRAGKSYKKKRHNH